MRALDVEAVQAFVLVAEMNSFTRAAEALDTTQSAISLKIKRLEDGDFYILCPDNSVTRRLDELRIAWAAGDIVHNRPALSRWHPDYQDAFAAYLANDGR